MPRRSRRSFIASSKWGVVYVVVVIVVVVVVDYQLAIKIICGSHHHFTYTLYQRRERISLSDKTK